MCDSKIISNKQRELVMNIDFMGRINNVSLTASNALIPLFEAIINSIHAIEEANVNRGEIEIRIERDHGQLKLEKDSTLSPIYSFSINDNGIGFNDLNYQSFCMADSTYKSNKGGKGIGRFTWLKAFDEVDIKSTFRQDKDYRIRTFKFRYTKEGVEDHHVDLAAGNKLETKVHLKNYKDIYKNICPRNAEILALRIIEHLLVYFNDQNIPNITLIDEKRQYNLNDIFSTSVQKYSQVETIRVKQQDFKITDFRLYTSNEDKHLLHFCANNREVLNRNLSSFINDLTKKLKDEDGRSFTYSSYVESAYLDKNVNAERTNFTIPDKNSDLLKDDVSFEELIEGVTQKICQRLKPFLDMVKETKINRIRAFVNNEAPQYRVLMKYIDEFIDEFPSDLPNDKLDIELHKVERKVSTRLKEKGSEILNTDISDVGDIEKYKHEFMNFMQEVNELGKSKLVEHIIHRKLMLDLLDKRLQMNNQTDKYELEESIHEIVFPLRKTSDDIDYEKQNLWIIDEKLSYHSYLASDTPLKKHSALQSDSLERPDLVIYDNPISFVEGDVPYSSIQIVEFKRPVRKDYSEDDDNPLTQVYRYIEKIQNRTIIDHKGRMIPYSENTIFFCYIIADLTEKLRTIVKQASFKESPDKLGYFNYNESYKAFIEVIPYDKLLRDAQKRNQILFDKLNLPKHNVLTNT